MLSLIVERALRGEASPRADLDFLEDSPTLDELVEAAHLVTTKCASRVFNFCTIVNAKSGRCAEDCRWCSQSSKWTTNAPVFPIVPATRGESAAARALEHGIRRLSFVTSGRKLSARELREIRPVVEAAASTGLEVCASMGLLTEPELTGLREAGLVRYHCNLETSPDFFPKVCTTHTQTDKIRTLEAARRAGLGISGPSRSSSCHCSHALRTSVFTVFPLGSFSCYRSVKHSNIGNPTHCGTGVRKKTR